MFAYSIWFIITSQATTICRELSNLVPVLIKESLREIQVSWTAPRDNGYKVTVDGSYHRSSSMAACDGLIRDFSCTLMKGFFYNLGPCNSVWAKLWALRLGIKLARSLSLSPVCFELDSQVVVNMVQIGVATTNFFNIFYWKFLIFFIELLEGLSYACLSWS